MKEVGLSIATTTITYEKLYTVEIFKIHSEKKEKTQVKIAKKNKDPINKNLENLHFLHFVLSRIFLLLFSFLKNGASRWNSRTHYSAAS